MQAQRDTTDRLIDDVRAVQERHPAARLVAYGPRHAVEANGRRLSSLCQSPEAAWRNAAKRCGAA
jgi:hypothetical protein